MGGDTKGKGKERADLDLRNVPLDIQEALILEDLLYVLMVRSGFLLCTPFKTRRVSKERT